MSLIICGDVHGKTKEFSRIVEKHPDDYIVQIGDFGFKDSHEWVLSKRQSNIKVLLGNHDDYAYLNREHSLGNWGTRHLGPDSFFCVRGGLSIDKKWRTAGLDWWCNEELSPLEMIRCLADYKAASPSLMISHEAPIVAMKALYGAKYEAGNKFIEENYGVKVPSETANLLEHCWQAHRPKVWVTGHHHQSFRKNIGGCEFIMLDELETIKI